MNTPKTLADDPQFQDRLPVDPAGAGRARRSCRPRSRSSDEELPLPTKAPTVGEHTEDVLREVLGYDDERIAALRAAGALG